MGKAPEYNGFITNLANIHSGDLWYLDRRFVVGSYTPSGTFHSGFPTAQYLKCSHTMRHALRCD